MLRGTYVDVLVFFCFKQKTAYEMRISDWSSDVCSSDLKTILFFHGNGDNMIGAIEATREPGAAGHGLMLVEYRGYGGNPGSPGEAGLYRGGEAATRWLGEAGAAAGDVVIVCHSCGSGPASDLGRRHDFRALVLASG